MTHTGPRLTARLAHAIIRRYPRRWRAEYGEELHAFIDDVPPGWRDVFDLARGCVVERGRTAVLPEEHPTRAAVVHGVVSMIPPVAVTVGAILFGGAIRERFGAPPNGVGAAGLVLVAVVMGLGARAHLRFNRSNARQDPSAWRLPRRSYVLVWTASFALMLVWFGWADDGIEHGRLSEWLASLPGGRWLRLWPAPFALRWAMNFYWPTRMELDLHLQKVAYIREQIGWQRLEVERCETLAAEGGPAPITQARRKMAKLEAEHAEAVEAIRAVREKRRRG